LTYKGATITLSTSWDVWAHCHKNMELYGTEGSLYVPDPKFFGGELELIGADGTARDLDEFAHPFSVPNMDNNGIKLPNYRSAGLADMAMALFEGRAHRCSVELALHVVDVMTAILTSGEEGRFVELTTSCVRPAALSPVQAQALVR